MSEQEGPIRASEVEEATPEDLGLSEEQIKTRKAAAAVRARRAKREALKRIGVAPEGNPEIDLAARLEAGADRAREASVQRFKAKRAVAARLREKRGEAS